MSDVMIEINAICEFDENRKNFLFQIIPIAEELEKFTGNGANLEEIGQCVGAMIDKVCVSYNKLLSISEDKIQKLQAENEKLKKDRLSLVKCVRFYEQVSKDDEPVVGYHARECLKEIGEMK